MAVFITIVEILFFLPSIKLVVSQARTAFMGKPSHIPFTILNRLFADSGNKQNMPPSQLGVEDLIATNPRPSPLVRVLVDAIYSGKIEEGGKRKLLGGLAL
jgi:hypothetical protein